MKGDKNKKKKKLHKGMRGEWFQTAGWWTAPGPQIKKFMNLREILQNGNGAEPPEWG